MKWHWATCCVSGSFVLFVIDGFLKPIGFQNCINIFSIYALFTAEFQKIWLTKSRQDEDIKNSRKHISLLLFSTGNRSCVEVSLLPWCINWYPCKMCAIGPILKPHRISHLIAKFAQRLHRSFSTTMKPFIFIIDATQITPQPTKKV